MNDPNYEANNQSPNSKSPVSDGGQKKPYVKPKLTKLGHVTDLTKGNGSLIDDNVGGLEGNLNGP